MESLLSTLKLDYERLSATDSYDVSNVDTSPLSPSEFACISSHIRASERLLASTWTHLLVLEDDAALHTRLIRHKPKLIKLIHTLPGWMSRTNVNLLQIGHIGHLYNITSRSGLAFRFVEMALGKKSQTVRIAGYKLRIWQNQFRAGAHAYIIDREFAKFVSKQPNSGFGIDDLFTYVASANVNSNRDGLRVASLDRSLFEQESRTGSKGSALDSDIS